MKYEEKTTTFDNIQSSGYIPNLECLKTSVDNYRVYEWQQSSKGCIATNTEKKT